MVKPLDHADWNQIVRLPCLVLMSFRSDQGRLYRTQIDRFVRDLSASTRVEWDGIQGQLLDDALWESGSVIGEVKGLNANAVVTGARQAINTTRRALDDGSCQDYLSVMLSLHGAIGVAVPWHARIRDQIRQSGTRVHGSVRDLLEDAIGAPQREPAEERQGA